eukprot:GHUV01030873.1.p1 GENE.GHUV01030873.1~~GHUV01030873.1.p1  ORF type:complete len:449 (+),score=169.30 GHUV01030873.1:574-1920(+)
MLAPLSGKQLLITPQQRPQQPAQLPQKLHRDRQQSVLISAPAQVTLPIGCSSDQALQLLTAAGITYPALVKPLITAPPDSSAADVRLSQPTATGLANSRANSSRDGHALGAVFSDAGLQRLVSGACDPALQLPVVLQQFVPHGEALYKLYVMGPHVVLTRRTTLTLQQLYTAARAAAGGALGDTLDTNQLGVVLLNRVSAVPLAAIFRSDGSQQQQPEDNLLDIQQRGYSAAQTLARQEEQQQHTCADSGPPAVRTDTCASTHAHVPQAREQSEPIQLQQNFPTTAQTRATTSTTATSLAVAATPGVAVADASVADDPAAPPLWVMQQLAAYLRQQLQLSLFNVDIIAPQWQPGQQQQPIAQQPQQQPELKEMCCSTEQHGSTSSSNWTPSAVAEPAVGVEVSERGGVGQYLVVDINFFPGYDKVPGAEQLFADFLSSLRPNDGQGPR